MHKLYPHALVCSCHAMRHAWVQVLAPLLTAGMGGSQCIDIGIFFVKPTEATWQGLRLRKTNSWESLDGSSNKWYGSVVTVIPIYKCMSMMMNLLLYKRTTMTIVMTTTTQVLIANTKKTSGWLNALPRYSWYKGLNPHSKILPARG